MKASLLCCVVISLTGLAPAYSLPLTPDQAEVQAENHLESKYSRQAEELELRFNELVIKNLCKDVRTHRLYFMPDVYEIESVTLFKRNLEKANWDVYESRLEGETYLKIVRHNTVPE